MDAGTLINQAMKQVVNSMESLKKSPCKDCGKEFEARFTRNKYVREPDADGAWIRVDSTCPGCHGIRQAEYEKRLEMELAEKNKKYEEDLKAAPGKRLSNIPRILRNILPPKFAGMTYPMPEFLGRYIPPATSGVCLYGKSGTGKTTAISMMIREYYIRLARDLKTAATWEPKLHDEFSKPRYDWKFISYPEFIMSLQNSFKEESEETAEQMLNRIASVPYLFIDDLGAEKPTEFVRQSTYYIINHREMNLLPTYITTNFSLDHLDKNIDPRIASRIAGMCHIVKMEGHDKRLKENGRL